MNIDVKILEQFKDDKTGLLKYIREMTPKKIAEELCSVQPMDGIDLMAVADALENYKWATPHCRFASPYDGDKDKQKLLNASRYIHELRCIDANESEFVNTIMHLYTAPFLIEIDDNL